MANPTGLGSDPSKINPYGASEESLQRYNDSLEESVKALQQRYEQPNWFKVAAGFAKPQLGGFVASLGSAAEAMGENVEKQREQQLPIAQMKAQLEQGRILMGQKKKAAELIAAHKGPMTAELAAELTRLDPEGAATKSANEEVKVKQAERGLAHSEYSDALQQARHEFDSGVLTLDQYQQRLNTIRNMTPKAGVPAVSPAPATQANPSANALLDDAEKNIEQGKPANALLDAAGKSIPGANAAGQSPAVEQPQESLPPFKFNLNKTTLAEIQRNIEKQTDPEVKKDLQYSLEHQIKNTKTPEVLQSGLGRDSSLTPEQNRYAVEQLEKPAAARYAALGDAVGGEKFNALVKPVENQIDLISNNKKAAARVSAVLARSPFFAALNKGITVSLNGIHAQVSAPTETWVRAHFPEEDVDLAMAMGKNYADIELAKQALSQVNPNAARNVTLSTYGSSTPNLDTTANASLRALLHLKQDIYGTRAQYENATDILQGKRPDVKYAPGEPARMSLAMSHPSMTSVLDHYNEQHKKIEDSFQRHISGKK